MKEYIHINGQVRFIRLICYITMVNSLTLYSNNHNEINLKACDDFQLA